MSVTPNHSADSFNPRFSLVSWGAVFVGILLALAVSLVMNVLGTAIGGAAFSPTRVQAFGAGAGLWLVITTVLATSVGAYFAGACAPARGAIHGVLVWAGSMLVTVYLLSMAITGVSGAAFDAMGKGLSLAGNGVSGAVPHFAKGAEKSDIDLDLSSLRSRFENLLEKNQGTHLDANKIKNQGAELVKWVQGVAQQDKSEFSKEDKDKLVQLIVSNTNRSRPEAQKMADEAEQMYKQAFAKYKEVKQEATERMRKAAKATASGVSRAAWWMFAMLTLGAAAAAAAGCFGYRQQDQQ